MGFLLCGNSPTTRNKFLLSVADPQRTEQKLDLKNTEQQFLRKVGSELTTCGAKSRRPSWFVGLTEWTRIYVHHQKRCRKKKVVSSDRETRYLTLLLHPLSRSMEISR